VTISLQKWQNGEGLIIKMNLGQIVEEIDSSILVQRQQSYNISKNAVRKVLKQES
jgi:hypothetical protein